MLHDIKALEWLVVDGVLVVAFATCHWGMERVLKATGLTDKWYARTITEVLPAIFLVLIVVISLCGAVGLGGDFVRDAIKDVWR